MFVHELGRKSDWESHRDDGQCRKECDFFHGAGKHPKEPPRRVWAHLHCYQMSEEGASVAPEGGERNRSDSLTDTGADGKLTECRSVARGGSSRRHTRPCRETLQAEKEPLVRVRTAAGR